MNSKMSEAMEFYVEQLTFPHLDDRCNHHRGAASRRCYCYLTNKSAPHDYNTLRITPTWCAVVIVLVHGRRSWRRMRARAWVLGPLGWDAESLIFTASLRDGMPSSSISVVREMSG